MLSSVSFPGDLFIVCCIDVWAFSLTIYFREAAFNNCKRFHAQDLRIYQEDAALLQTISLYKPGLCVCDLLGV